MALTNGHTARSLASSSNATLQAQLDRLRNASAEHGHALTQKLASSDSGQALLHIGTQLSSLPTDLHAAISHVHPILTACETTVQESILRDEIRPAEQAIDALRFRACRARAVATLVAQLQAVEAAATETHAGALERIAHVTRCLVDQFNAAAHASSSVDPNEYTACVLHLGSRIRACELAVVERLSEVLVQALQDETLDAHDDTTTAPACIRALLLLDHASDMERIVRNTAIVPILKTTLTLGTIDEGGPRGHCQGLAAALEAWSTAVAERIGPLLQQFPRALTPAVWDPLATALLMGPLSRAVLAPGHADVVQRNYCVVHEFIDRELVDKMKLDAALLYKRTEEWQKKWNLAIYYQLRFGDACGVVNAVVDQTRQDGWGNPSLAGSDENEASQVVPAFRVELFVAVQKVLLGFWQPNVILRPLTHRFLRGAVQVVGRLVAFVEDGMQGKILFGEKVPSKEVGADVSSSNSPSDSATSVPPPPLPSTAEQCSKGYKWVDDEDQVAMVSWELYLLSSWLQGEYVDLILESLGESNHDSKELRTIVAEVLKESCCEPIQALIEKAWNSIIREKLTAQCLVPLASVKGVAATYRMTNRPPPTQASPFVPTILRPVQAFATKFANRIPITGAHWKHAIAVTVADKYATAVDELLATIQRTEHALRNRRGRRNVGSGNGMSDGEKVKLQLYWDVESFSESVRSLGLEPTSIVGVSRLEALTAEGKALVEPNGVSHGT